VLPIERWTVYYEDGSTFSSDQGSWAEAPSFGVHAVVWYNTAGVTLDSQGLDDAIHYWIGPKPNDISSFFGIPQGSSEPVKMGLWTDGESYWRVHDLVRKEVTP